MVNDDMHDSRSRTRAGCLQTAHRETLEWPVVAVSLSTTLAAVLVYSATGPMLSDAMYRVGQRLLLTGLCAAIAWPLWYSTTAMLLYVARHLPPALILGLCAVSVLFVATPFVALGYAAVELFGLRPPAFPDIYLNAVAWVAACNSILLYTVCVRAKLRRRAVVVPSERPASEGPVESPPPTVSGADRRAAPPDVDPREPRTGAALLTTEQHVRFLDRLPAKLGQDVVYLSVSGHYVNAVTSQGSGVILMRFADAVAELGGMGMQVHRSHWVAHDHITAVYRRDERTFVRVTGGHEVPVSRSHLSAVRALTPEGRHPTASG